MNTYSIIQQLCSNAGTTVSAMCRHLGISPSTLSELKAGRTKALSAPAMSRIAEYFHVSTDYLLGKSQPNAQEAALSPLYFRFGKKAQEMGLSEQDLQFMLNFMADHKRRNNREDE